MILVDANILVYAKIAEFPRHEAARAWLDERLDGTTRVGIPWESSVAFMRIVTNPRILAHPVPSRDAWTQVREWLACTPAWVPRPTDDHDSILDDLLSETGATGNLLHDAHIAAIAIGHGLRLCSTDGDFARFASLNWRNPLATAVHDGR